MDEVTYFESQESPDSTIRLSVTTPTNERYVLATGLSREEADALLKLLNATNQGECNHDSE